MKILLINPKTLFPGKMPPIPLGLLQIGAQPYLDGHDVEILDCNITQMSEIENKIKTCDPELVGFNTLTGKGLSSCIHLSKFTKKNSDGIVVWGGVHTSLLPLQVIKENYIDISVIGEGDLTFNEIVKKNIKNLGKIKNILYKKNGKIFRTPQSTKPIENLNVLPQIQWELLPPDKYLSSRWMNNITTLVLPTSRGCPYSCTFCYNRKYSKGIWRSFSLEWIKKNLENLTSNYKIHSLRLDYEDNFIGNDRERALNIAKLMKKFDITWACQLRANDINRELLNKFKGNGCNYMFIGVESGSQRILDFLEKGTTIKRIKKTFGMINEMKMRAVASFIMDLPTEKSEDLDKTVKLAKRLNAITTINYYQAFPGTGLYDYLVMNNMLKTPESTEEWSKADYSTWHNFSNIPSWKLKSVYYYMNYLWNVKNLIEKRDFNMLYLLSKNTIDAISRNLNINLDSDT